MEAEKKSAEGVEEAADTTEEPVVEAAAIQQQLNRISAADKADKASPLPTAAGTPCSHTLMTFRLTLTVLHTCTPGGP